MAERGRAETADGLGSLQAARARALAAAPELEALSFEQRAEAVERAAQRLCDPGDALGRELRAALGASSGLSAGVIEWGLTTTLERFTADGVRALHGDRRPAPPGAGLCAVVLAGNVFSASARPILLGLSCGRPLLVKASSRDDALPRALVRALREEEPILGRALEVLTFAHGEPALEAELAVEARTLVVYGSDRTLEAWRGRLGGGAELVGHGHGIGLGYVERASEIAAAAVARDVAAYDQRGCLSPHAVLVGAGAHEFAEMLVEALEGLAAEWPRGGADAQAASAELQWRGVAAARGELWQGPNAAVSYEGSEALRASPSRRNVGVYDCASLEELRRRCAALGTHLKALGVAADPGVVHDLQGLAPYVCAAGAMQDPPLHARLDGLHPLHGF